MGSSRRWIDDNGYFVIQVEFQSEAYEKGSALNVGISFLWETSQGVNETLAYMFGCSVDEVGYVSYAGDDAAFAGENGTFCRGCSGESKGIPSVS